MDKCGHYSYYLRFILFVLNVTKKEEIYLPSVIVMMFQLGPAVIMDMESQPMRDIQDTTYRVMLLMMW